MLRRRKQRYETPSAVGDVFGIGDTQVAEHILSVSTAKMLEAGDPDNPLGRDQTIITDISRVRTTEGLAMSGVRIFKLLGAKGTIEEQAENPFLRAGSVYAARLGRPSNNMLTVRRAADLLGSGHQPDFKLVRLGSKVVEAIKPDEAFASARKFDDLYFSDNETRVVGIPEGLLGPVRSVQREVFAYTQGLAPDPSVLDG